MLTDRARAVVARRAGRVALQCVRGQRTDTRSRDTAVAMRRLAGSIAGDVAVRRKCVGVDAILATDVSSNSLERVRRGVAGGRRMHAEHRQAELAPARAAELVQSVLKRLQRAVLRLARIAGHLDDRRAQQVGQRDAAVVAAVAALLSTGIAGDYLLIALARVARKRARRAGGQIDRRVGALAVRLSPVQRWCVRRRVPGIGCGWARRSP